MSDELTCSEEQIRQRLDGELMEWKYTRGQLRRRFRTANWRASMMVANAIGYLAEAAWHHPELTVSWGAVEVAVSTPSAGGITDKDFQLAAEIERVIGWQPGAESALEGTPDEARGRLLERG